MFIQALSMVCHYLSPTIMGVGAGYDRAAARSFLQTPLGQQLQQQWKAAVKEKDLQACLNQMVLDMLSRFHGLSRTYWDTSGKLGNMPVVLCDNVANIDTTSSVLSFVVTYLLCRIWFAWH